MDERFRGRDGMARTGDYLLEDFKWVTWGWCRRIVVVVAAGRGEGPHPARCITLVVPAGGAIDARVAHARRTFAAVALADEPPQQVGAVVAVGGLVEGLLGEGVGAMGRGRGLRHGGRTGRAGRARYSCRGAQGRAALSERLSRPTIAARLPPAPHAPRARVNRPRTPRAAPRRRPARPLRTRARRTHPLIKLCNGDLNVTINVLAFSSELLSE